MKVYFLIMIARDKFPSPAGYIAFSLALALLPVLPANPGEAPGPGSRNIPIGAKPAMFRPVADPPASYELPPEEELALLVRAPRMTRMEFLPGPAGSAEAFAAATEYHAVFPVSGERYWRALTDFAYAREMNPMSLETDFDFTSWPPNLRQRQLYGISFLGIRIAWNFLIDAVYLDDGEGSRRISWWLVENAERQFFDVSGYMWVRDLPPGKNGEPRCYVRYCSGIGMLKSFPGIKGFVRRYGSKEIRAALFRYEAAAEKLAD